MKQVIVPDLESGPWSPLYSKDFYYDPKTEKIVYSKISVEITKKELALRDRLLPYWMGKATRFRHDDPKANAECVVIKPLNDEPAVMMWGLQDQDQEKWARAIKENGFWKLMTTHDKWEFGDWELSSDEKKLVSFTLYLNDRKLVTY